MDSFINLFDVVESDPLVNVNGLFGYSSYDAVQHFESINFDNKVEEEYEIPEMRYTYYKYILAFNHLQTSLI